VKDNQLLRTHDSVALALPGYATGTSTVLQILAIR